jgi:3-deoxy-D-manno-octulosonic-acid transferase
VGPLGHSVAALTALLGAPLLASVALARPRWREGLAERLGAHPVALAGRAPIWVHGASVGEIRAALPLLDALAGRGHALVASTMTLSGRSVARAARPALATSLAPLDHPWAVARALARVRPSALVFVETELWPSWVRAASERGIPALVVSGRLSERSFRRWQRAGGLLRATLSRYRAIAARSEADAARFVALGAAPERVSVCGDLKLDAAPPVPPAPELAALLGELPLVVAGSTHEGEEAAALSALAAAERAGRSAALALAPRHPERFERVAELVRESGRRLRRRSAPGPGPLVAGEVLLLDTLGELASLYPRAALAFVGGTLVPIGGHNLVEPALAGCPILIGPHVTNIRDTAALLLEADSARTVHDADALAAAVVETLAQPAAARARAARAGEVLAPHRGATSRCVALIERVLEGRA